jgi:diketogulonate reductase-like aldo/keto reductase
VTGPLREIHKRTIPRTKELIPALGLGTYRTFDVGSSNAERTQLRDVLRFFVESGGRAVDSSPMYGSAEAVAGDLIEELRVRDSLFIMTKVWTTGRSAGVRQMEASFKLLHANVIDLMQVHNLVDWVTHLATIRELQEEGRVRYTGITHYTASAYDAVELVMKAARPDFIQINYSIISREAEKRLLPLAADLGIGVIVNRPFEQSGLFRELRGRRIPAWAQDFGCTSWAQFCLKFILSHPAVTCVIPATGNHVHIADNMQAAFGTIPDQRTREKMARYVENPGGGNS